MVLKPPNMSASGEEELADAFVPSIVMLAVPSPRPLKLDVPELLPPLTVAAADGPADRGDWE